MHLWYGMGVVYMHLWYGMGVVYMHSRCGMVSFPSGGSWGWYVCTTLIYFMYASVSWHTCTFAYNRVYFYNCMQPSLTSAIYSVHCSPDREKTNRAQFSGPAHVWNIIEYGIIKYYIEQFGEISKHSKVKTFSQIDCCWSTLKSCCCAVWNLIEYGLIKYYIKQPPSSVWWNFKTFKIQNLFINWLLLVHFAVLLLRRVFQLTVSGVHFCPVMSDQKAHWKEQKEPVFVSTFVNLESSSSRFVSCSLLFAH